MSYVVQAVNHCTKKIIFNFDSVDLTKEIKNALTKKQQETHLKGFRKGKAPLEMVEKFYTSQIKGEALSQFVSDKFYEAIQKEKIQAIGYPVFNNTKFENEKNISFEALVETFPEFEIKDYKSYSFKKETPADVETELATLKKNYLMSKSEVVEVTDSAVTLQKGHLAVINFTGTDAQGNQPESMKAQDFLIEIGSERMIPGFEQGLMGMKKGEKKNLDLTFPENYHVEDLKNKKVVFAVEVLEIKEKKIPELTDDMAKEFGYESAKDFDLKNRKTIEFQNNKKVEQKLHQDILEKLVEDNKFEIPGTLLQEQKKYLQEDLKRNLKAQGFNDKMAETYFSKWEDDLNKKATFQVASGLILDKLAQKYSVDATEKDLEEKMNEISAYSNTEKDKLLEYYNSNPNLKKNLMYAIREEKTFACFLKDVKIS
ncbi:MAG: trigger factor [Bacteriovoracaceae bacterium]|nr:trigger factor [Bacteriovoracaceae bacterium]